MCVRLYAISIDLQVKVVFSTLMPKVSLSVQSADLDDLRVFCVGTPSNTHETVLQLKLKTGLLDFLPFDLTHVILVPVTGFS
jgi:hypothetical protein